MHVLREKAMAGIILLKLAARRHQMHTLVGCLKASQSQSYTRCTGYVSLRTKLFQWLCALGQQASMQLCTGDNELPRDAPSLTKDSRLGLRSSDCDLEISCSSIFRLGASP